MTLSKKLTSRHIAVVALAVGMSAPLYSMADTPPAADTATAAKVMADTTTTVKHKAHRAEHKARAAAENKAEAVKNAKELDAEAAKGAEKRVVWKNGVVFHDVEPSGQAAGAFAAPASTSDTLQGGVTTTPVH